MADEWIERARAAWRWRGDELPPFADPPGPGQESVWEYPRPPRVEPVAEAVRVELAGVVLAASGAALRVLETASAPAIYVPVADVRPGALEPTPEGAVCEWKGPWIYWNVLAGGRRAERAAWSYTDPWPGYEALGDRIAFYPGRVDACFLGGERVRPQPGGFYGGWVTDAIAGPMKGGPGSSGW